MDYKKAFLESLIVVDLETTSADKKDCEIIEFGAATFTNGNWVSNSKLFKPTEPIPPESSAVNGISNAMVAQEPHFMDASNISELENDVELRVAHNVAFDKVVLESHGFKYDRDTWLCTYQLSKKLFSFIKDNSISRFDLPYLRYALNLDCDHLSSHRAGDDCVVTGKLLCVLLDIMEECGIIQPDESYLPQIVDFMDTPVILETVPFGKHKGKRFDEVPTDYWIWAVNNMDSLNEDSESYDSDLAESILRSLS